MYWELPGAWPVLATSPKEGPVLVTPPPPVTEKTLHDTRNISISYIDRAGLISVSSAHLRPARRFCVSVRLTQPF